MRGPGFAARLVGPQCWPPVLAPSSAPELHPPAARAQALERGPAHVQPKRHRRREYQSGCRSPLIGCIGGRRLPAQQRRRLAEHLLAAAREHHLVDGRLAVELRHARAAQPEALAQRARVRGALAGGVRADLSGEPSGRSTSCFTSNAACVTWPGSLTLSCKLHAHPHDPTCWPHTTEEPTSTRIEPARTLPPSAELPSRSFSGCSTRRSSKGEVDIAGQISASSSFVANSASIRPEQLSRRACALP